MRRHQLIVGGSRDARRATAKETAAAYGRATLELEPRSLPFRRPETVPLPESPRLILINDAELAFPNRQTAGTRLVLTQSTYLVQKWLDRLSDADQLVLTGDCAAIEQAAPEALRGHGPWRHFEIMDLGETATPSISDVSDEMPFGPEGDLTRAFASESTEERLGLCQSVVARHGDSAVAHLAAASAYRESQKFDEARECLTQAAKLAPGWEAVHHETGKFWLAAEDMEQASEAFKRATELMPTFSGAFANLGATLGELGHRDDAYAAFSKALESDPDNITILNNIGVVCRELGRLQESIASLERVVADAPEFVFGHYNLGHSFLLAGHAAAALAAYEEGQARDPQKNRRQGCRLAVVRFANGDVAGAERDLSRFANAAPPEEREDLLLEAYEIAQALLAAMPALAPHRRFLEWIAGQLRGVY